MLFFSKRCIKKKTRRHVHALSPRLTILRPHYFYKASAAIVTETAQRAPSARVVNWFAEAALCVTAGAGVRVVGSGVVSSGITTVEPSSTGTSMVSIASEPDPELLDTVSFTGVVVVPASELEPDDDWVAFEPDDEALLDASASPATSPLELPPPPQSFALAVNVTP